jgi:hypothetical protein
VKAWSRSGLVVGFFGFALVAACDSQATPADHKLVIVFVDMSASVRDHSVYEDAWAKIIDEKERDERKRHLRYGDRIVLGMISSDTYTRFRPALDQELPIFNPFKDNKLKYERRIKEIREGLAGSLKTVLSGKRSAKTDIMNCLALAEKIFAGDKRRRVLVILSDMLEDSEDYNFERVKITDVFTRKVIEAKRQRGELPDLGGATVYVAGASAATAGRAHEVERFWIEYMKAANGKLTPQNYGPALVNFQE